MLKSATISVLASAVAGAYYGGERFMKRSGAHCKNYWQLSITSPNLTSCQALVAKNI
jgi:hypothetical protein